MSGPVGSRYEPIAVSAESTVVAEFIREASPRPAYQSEADLEREFIELLRGQAYEYLPITSEAELVANLRAQLEALNGITFSDGEWSRFFAEQIAGANDGIVEKTVRIQEDHVQLLKRDDGSTKNITLIDKQNIHNNRLQVINQYEVGRGRRRRRRAQPLRRDGPRQRAAAGARRAQAARRGHPRGVQPDRPLPAGQLLGRLGAVRVRAAVRDQQRHADEVLLQHHAARSTSSEASRRASGRARRRTPSSSPRGGRTRRTSRSRTSTGFTKTFFAKHTLLNILTQYCVLTADRMLLVMRPYQIVATERILQRIEISTNYKQLGTIAAGGYVWHTTGSGKTLTSLQDGAARVAAAAASTRCCSWSTARTSTTRRCASTTASRRARRTPTPRRAMLKRQLEDPSARIIITTIQKLATFVAANKGHAIYDGHVVHHLRRVPPLAVRRHAHRDHQGVQALPPVRLHRHADLRGERRHRRQPAAADHRAGVRRPAAHLHDRRRDHRQERAAVPHRLRQHDQGCRTASPTSRSRRSTPSGRCSPPSGSARSSATSSSTSTRRPGAASTTRSGEQAGPRLQLAVRHGLDRGGQALLRGVRRRSRQELPPDRSGSRSGSSTPTPPTRRERRLPRRGGLRDRRARRSPRATSSTTRSRTTTRMFGTCFDTSADKFQNYYKDLSLRLKNREIDLVIVVNMFLTGFDATHAEHAVGRQEPARPRPDPGLLAHQPHPQLGQDLRQHRLLPRPRGGDQRRHRALRQQGRPRHRAAQAVRRVLRRVRGEGRRAARPVPARASRSSASRRRRTSSRSSARSCGCRTS